MESARGDVGGAVAQAAPRFRAARGVLLEVRPLPMAAALLIALLGTLWAGRPLWPVPSFLPSLLAAVFLGLLTAHFMDSFVDVVLRGDRTPGDFPLAFRDSTGLLRNDEYPRAVVWASVSALLAISLLARRTGPLPAVPLLFALVLAVAYAPLLDRRLLGVTFGYPAGAVAVLSGSFVAAGGTVDLRFAWLGAALFVALVGIKVRADVIDAADDAKIGKRTLASLLGERAATRGGYALAVGGLVAAALAPLLFAVPVAFAFPPLGAAAAFAATTRMSPMRAALWMSHAMLAALALEVVVLSL